MKSQLTGPNQRTYDAIFGHPLTHSLSWRKVCSLLGEVGQVTEQPNGNLKATCNRHTLVLHPARDRNIADMHELMAIRHLLKRINEGIPGTAAPGTHLLVVVDHREARVYKTELHGAVPQCITPLVPSALNRQRHYVQKNFSGLRKPEQKPFYNAVIKTLENAQKILIFGSGTGASNAMTHLVAEIKCHHGELAQRIVGGVVLDQRHLSENQLLAAARAFYAEQAGPVTRAEAQTNA